MSISFVLSAMQLLTHLFLRNIRLLLLLLCPMTTDTGPLPDGKVSPQLLSPVGITLDIMSRAGNVFQYWDRLLPMKTEMRNGGSWFSPPIGDMWTSL